MAVRVRESGNKVLSRGTRVVSVKGTKTCSSCAKVKR